MPAGYKYGTRSRRPRQHCDRSAVLQGDATDKKPAAPLLRPPPAQRDASSGSNGKTDDTSGDAGKPDDEPYVDDELYSTGELTSYDSQADCSDPKMAAMWADLRAMPRKESVASETGEPGDFSRGVKWSFRVTKAKFNGASEEVDQYENEVRASAPTQTIRDRNRVGDWVEDTIARNGGLVPGTRQVVFPHLPAWWRVLPPELAAEEAAPAESAKPAGEAAPKEAPGPEEPTTKPVEEPETREAGDAVLQPAVDDAAPAGDEAVADHPNAVNQSDDGEAAAEGVAADAAPAEAEVLSPKEGGSEPAAS
jgi:hypothetical protein